jgi:hypothetical protein
MQHLIIDGMLSGTGVRDGAVGGYLDLKNVGLSADLTKRIEAWLIAYESAHYSQFGDKAVNDRLDQEGDRNRNVCPKGAARRQGGIFLERSDAKVAI